MISLAALSAWAPIPLRLALGVGLIRHGGIKLFAPGGHANIAHLLGELGVPFANAMAWIVGGVEFLGGLGILVGASLPLTAGINALNVAGLLVLGAIRGGIPAPLPGGDPLPSFREAFLILAAALTLVLGGAGPLALGGNRRNGPSRSPFPGPAVGASR
jgi:putative oxidoreductase